MSSTNPPGGVIPPVASSGIPQPTTPSKFLSPPTPHLTGLQAYADERMKSARGAANVLNPQSPGARPTPNYSPNPSVGAFDALRHGGPISRPSDAPTPVGNTSSFNRVPPELQKLSSPFPRSSPAGQPHPVGVGIITSTQSTDHGAGQPHVDGDLSQAEQKTPSTPQLVSNESMVSVDDASYPPDSTPGKLASPPTPGSRSGTRHQCQHCDQSFTRQHNLKSHLLTHSQLRPYSCSIEGCNQEFRRMHDKKRHEKLHTGEKSYQCKICNRAFARGDALSRHQKGPGGCVGRVSSISSTLDGTSGDAMEDVQYSEEGAPSRKRPRQISLPHMHEGGSTTGLGRPSQDQHQGSTYPPLHFRQNHNTEPYFNGTSAASPYEPRLAPLSQPPTPSFPPPMGQHNPSATHGILGAPGMSESPAPLTPGSNPPPPHEGRQDSMATQLAKTQLNSRRSTMQSPQTFGGMGPPFKSSVHHPQLPSIHSLQPSQNLPTQQAQFGGPAPQTATGPMYPPPPFVSPTTGPVGSGSSGGQTPRANTSNDALQTQVQALQAELQTAKQAIKDLEAELLEVKRMRIRDIENEVGQLRRRVIHLESEQAANGSGSSKDQPLSGQP